MNSLFLIRIVCRCLFAGAILGGSCIANCFLRSACAAQPIRFATFNVSLYAEHQGGLAERLEGTTDSQAAVIAEIIQRVRPDVLLLNEFDFDAHEVALNTFQENYLERGQNVSESDTGPAQPIVFEYSFSSLTNTGVHSRNDLDRNQRLETKECTDHYAGDCWGFGRYPGQYGMALLSRFPIKTEEVRTFRKFLWKDMPGARLPDNTDTPGLGDWYAEDVLKRFPLSSKSHWDIPIEVNGRTIHVLASHPTPPVYDGPEDRNGRRNHDEIRFWVDYIEGGQQGRYIYDDIGKTGSLTAGTLFVIMGDLNGDPQDGQATEGIAKLLASPRVAQYPPPVSEGGQQQSTLQAGVNLAHQGNAAADTLDAPDDPGPGNLRLDYVLPARGIKCVASGVFWPNNNDKLFTLVGVHPFPGTDHRLVWMDLSWEEMIK